MAIQQTVICAKLKKKLQNENVLSISIHVGTLMVLLRVNSLILVTGSLINKKCSPLFGLKYLLTKNMEEVYASLHA